MTLDYLDFDYSDDGDGQGSFDALASVAPAQVAAVHAEIETVLAWAHAQFPGGPGALVGTVVGGVSWVIVDLLRGTSVLKWLRHGDPTSAPAISEPQR